MRVEFEYEIVSNHSTIFEINEYTEEEWDALSEEKQKEFLDNLYFGEAYHQAMCECDYEIVPQDYNLPTISFDE